MFRIYCKGHKPYNGRPALATFYAEPFRYVRPVKALTISYAELVSVRDGLLFIKNRLSIIKPYNLEIWFSSDRVDNWLGGGTCGDERECRAIRGVLTEVIQLKKNLHTKAIWYTCCMYCGNMAHTYRKRERTIKYEFTGSGKMRLTKKAYNHEGAYLLGSP